MILIGFYLNLGSCDPLPKAMTFAHDEAALIFKKNAFGHVLEETSLPRELPLHPSRFTAATTTLRHKVIHISTRS